MIALILSGGQSPEISMLASYAAKADVLIGVDGAADLLAAHRIVPDILIGDFDTAKSESVQSLEAQGAVVIRLNARKNQTDTQAAVDYAIQHGAKEIVMLGAVGSRIDHSLSNIMMLVRADRKGVRAKIVDAYNELAVCTGQYTLYGRTGQTVSILPLTEDVTVCASGLEYPLDHLLLPFGSSRGVSNVLTQSKAALNIDGGYAMVVVTTDQV